MDNRHRPISKEITARPPPIGAPQAYLPPIRVVKETPASSIESTISNSQTQLYYADQTCTGIIERIRVIRDNLSFLREQYGVFRTDWPQERAQLLNQQDQQIKENRALQQHLLILSSAHKELLKKVAGLEFVLQETEKEAEHARLERESSSSSVILDNEAIKDEQHLSDPHGLNTVHEEAHNQIGEAVARSATRDANGLVAPKKKRKCRTNG